jgi:hypothetical protein
LAEFGDEASENNKNGLSQQAEESVGEGSNGLGRRGGDLKQEELESGIENHPDADEEAHSRSNAMQEESLPQADLDSRDRLKLDSEEEVCVSAKNSQDTPADVDDLAEI